MSKQNPATESEISLMMDRIAAADFGAGDAADLRALDDYIAGVPDRAALHASITRLWDDLGSVEAPQLFDDASSEQSAAGSADDWRSWHRSGHLRVAAAILPVIAMVGAILLAFGVVTSGDQVTRIAASAVERRIVDLADGSTVSLSANSSVEVMLKRQRRNVVLQQGEALFDVAHDPERPFVVVAGNGEIQAIGTSFNVLLVGDTVVVTVVEGTVSVRTGGEPGAGKKLVQLARAGQQVTFGSRAKSGTALATVSFLSPAKTVDPVRYTSWADGFLRFQGEPLGIVIEEVNRHSAKDLRLTDQKLADIKIYGVLHIGDVEGLKSIVKDIEGLDDSAISKKLVIVD